MIGVAVQIAQGREHGRLQRVGPDPIAYARCFAVPLPGPTRLVPIPVALPLGGRSRVAASTQSARDEPREQVVGVHVGKPLSAATGDAGVEHRGTPRIVVSGIPTALNEMSTRPASS